MATTVVRRPKKAAPTKAPEVPITELVEAFSAFRAAKNAEAAGKKKAEDLRDETLLPALVKHGVAHGEKGVHLAIELPEPVDGFVRIVRRANTSRFLDVDKAEKLLADKGVLEECQTIQVSIAGIGGTQLKKLKKLLEDSGLGELGDINIAVGFDQDRMMAYHQLHRDDETAKETAKNVGARKPRPTLTAEELDALIVTETSYAFFPERK